MASTLSQIIAQHHQTKMQEAQYDAEANMEVLRSWAKGGPYAPKLELAQHAYQKLQKKIPKDHVPGFQEWGKSVGLEQPASVPPLPGDSNTPRMQPGSAASPSVALTGQGGGSSGGIAAPPNPTTGESVDESGSAPDSAASAAPAPQAPAAPQQAPPSIQPPPPAQAAATAAASTNDSSIATPPPPLTPSAGFAGMSPIGASSSSAFGRVDPTEFGQREAAMALPGLKQNLEIEHQRQQMQYGIGQQRLKDIQAQPWYAGLSPRQRAQVDIDTLYGKPTSITPERAPISLRPEAGSDLPATTLDVNNKPIDPHKIYAVRQDIATGEKTYQPTVAFTTKVVKPDTTSSTGWSTFFMDRQGNEVNKTEVAPPAAYAQLQTNTGNTSQKVVNIDGKETLVPVTSGSSRTTQRIVPGQQPAVGGSSGGIAPPPTRSKGSSTAAPAAPGSPNLPRGSRVLGNSAGEQGRAEQNPLTPAGQTAMAETEPVLNQLQRAKQMLESVKDSNLPFTNALQRAGYSIGVATEASKLISNLELGKVVGAARVLKGSSRSRAALEMAMQHLPNVTKDSPKLMYQKLENIEQNLNDIRHAAQTYEQKYPGMQRPGSPTPPPTNRKPLSEIFGSQ